MRVFKCKEHSKYEKRIKLYINLHIIGVTKSWANKDISDDELGQAVYVMFRRDRMGRSIYHSFLSPSVLSPLLSQLPS